VAVQLGHHGWAGVRTARPLGADAHDRQGPLCKGEGEEFDIGELTTYLNDALFIAPSFLLRPEVTWAEIDAVTFDVTLRDAGRSVTGRVFLDEQGAPVDFATTDRFVASLCRAARGSAAG